MPDVLDWPAWASGSFWTLVIVSGAYAVGHLARLLVGARLSRLAPRTHGDWDDVLVAEVGRRIPFWAALVGVYAALPLWQLDDERQALAVTVLSAIGVASATFAVAAVATRAVSSYGPRATPAAPVSAL